MAKPTPSVVALQLKLTANGEFNSRHENATCAPDTRSMKETPPSVGSMVSFLLLKFKFLIAILIAFLLWQVPGFAASFAATEVTTSTILRTTEERDDSRLSRAFLQVKPNERLKVTFEKGTNPEQQTRDSHLTIVANTKHEALEAREARNEGCLRQRRSGGAFRHR